MARELGPQIQELVPEVFTSLLPVSAKKFEQNSFTQDRFLSVPTTLWQ